MTALIDRKMLAPGPDCAPAVGGKKGDAASNERMDFRSRFSIAAAQTRDDNSYRSAAFDIFLQR